MSDIGQLICRRSLFQTHLLQTAQQHFIAYDEDGVKRRQDKLLYPVVLQTQQQRMCDS